MWQTETVKTKVFLELEVLDINESKSGITNVNYKVDISHISHLPRKGDFFDVDDILGVTYENDKLRYCFLTDYSEQRVYKVRYIEFNTTENTIGVNLQPAHKRKGKLSFEDFLQWYKEEWE